VGVGQPMVVIFDKPPADKAAAEKALTVKAVPAVQGAWYWWDDRTLHYRAKTYWKPGTKITVSAKVYGVNLGGGAYGETDRSMTVTIGPSKIAEIDDATKQMQVFINGKKTKSYPVSLGMDKQVTVNGRDISFVTPSGIYVGQEKYAVKQMSSATYGLPVNSSLGYDSRIPLAVRFSNEGIFVHAAPWSVADQGVRNVSHGCVNLSPAAGRWFYDNFGYGDILIVKGTSTKLAPTDGYGDWNLSWERWLSGSALS
jgi:lipoprotein-anchoring transpeptidase ErfK/SrfK